MSDGFLDCKSRTQGSNICQIYFLTSAKIDSHLGNHFTIREWIQGFSFASILILTKFQGEGNSIWERHLSQFSGLSSFILVYKCAKQVRNQLQTNLKKGNVNETHQQPALPLVPGHLELK